MGCFFHLDSRLAAVNRMINRGHFVIRLVRAFTEINRFSPDSAPQLRSLCSKPQSQADIPNRLSQQLPEFLPGLILTTEAIWILFLIFLRESLFKAASAIIETDNIAGG